mmetsp:Transcript_463/g.644  ORF Transcript_463/g.644 Transcript_463/m.644 type:complete len:226 (-) Transcript_463:438-1115(-)
MNFSAKTPGSYCSSNVIFDLCSPNSSSCPNSSKPACSSTSIQLISPKISAASFICEFEIITCLFLCFFLCLATGGASPFASITSGTIKSCKSSSSSSSSEGSASIFSGSCSTGASSSSSSKPNNDSCSLAFTSEALKRSSFPFFFLILLKERSCSSSLSTVGLEIGTPLTSSRSKRSSSSNSKFFFAFFFFFFLVGSASFWLSALFEASCSSSTSSSTTNPSGTY